MKGWPALFLVLVVSGCLGADAPGMVPESAEPPGVADEAPTQSEKTTSDPAPSSTTAKEPASPNITSSLIVDFKGVIVARPGGTQHAIYEGDSPAFHFTLPENTTRIDATLTWSPSQDMGLEFQYEDKRYTSWGEDLTNRQVEPPIRMTLDDELKPGMWTVFLGPRIAGGAVDWELHLEFTIAGPAPESLDYEG